MLSGTDGFTAGSLNAPSAIAIDNSGDAWIANAGNSTLTELTGTGATAPNSPFSGGGLSTPSSVAIDAQGDVWIANAGNSSVSVFSFTGAPVSGASGYTASGIAGPTAIAIDPR